MALTSPYNFVPLNSNVYIPDWYNLVSQDIPFEDGEDGYIELTWHNDSPLFIRNGAKELPDGKPNVEAMCHDRRYFIPGSSIKGMLRNILSILAFGKMEAGEQYQNRFFGHREIGSGATDHNGYLDMMSQARCGWLEMYIDNADGKGHYRLHPCVGDFKPILINKNPDDIGEDFVKKYFPDYDIKGTPGLRNKAIYEECHKWFPEIVPGYRLYVSGKMNGKEHEVLIPTKTGERKDLDDTVAEEFFDVYEPSPDFEIFKELLKTKKIPVFYVQENETIIALGMGRMFRYPYNQGIKDIVEKEQDPDKYTGQRDLCETIFGWIGDDSAKGRVQFSNAWAKNKVSDDRDETNGVLGQPKASFYPLYIKQERSPKIYKSYSSKNIQISGRKRYRIHKGSSTMNLPQGNGNEKTKTSFKAIPAGNDFKMRINVHNLRPVEIGALLSAITFHNTCSAFHNIGAAKSFGYGKLHCDEANIKMVGFNKGEEDYLRAFETEMERFCLGHSNTNWINTDQVRMLLGIMSEHNDSDLKMMELKDYTNVKRSVAQSLQGHQEKSPRTFIDRNSQIELKSEDTIKKAKQFINDAEAKLHVDEVADNGSLSQIYKQAIKLRAEIEDIISVRKALCIDYTEPKQVAQQINKILNQAFRLQNLVDYEKAEKYSDISRFDLSKPDECERGKEWLSTAISIYVDLVNKKKMQGLDYSEEEHIIHQLKEQNNAIIPPTKNETLADILGEKTGALYRITKWSQCKEKIEQWIASHVLSDSDKDAIEETVRRLSEKPSHDEKKKKVWTKRDSHIWKSLEVYLGKERADELFTELNKGKQA